MLKTKSAFTLIECVVFIFLLLIVFAVGTSSFIDSRSQARKATMHDVETAIYQAVEKVKERAAKEGLVDEGIIMLELPLGEINMVSTTKSLYPSGTASGIGSAFHLSKHVKAHYYDSPDAKIVTFQFNDYYHCEVVYHVNKASGVGKIFTNYSGC